MSLSNLVRLRISVAVAVIVALISVGALVTVAHSGQKATQSQSSVKQQQTGQSSSSSTHLLSSRTSSRTPTPLNTTAETSTSCQTGILESLGVESTEVSCNTAITYSVGNLTLRLNPIVCYSDANIHLENSSTTAPIFGSFYHTLLYLNYNRTLPAHISAVYNVTGSQIVQGNWTVGYHLTYTNNELVNFSATLTNSSTYAITHVAKYPLPDRSYTDTYGSAQQKDVMAALSNSTVRSDMEGASYYVYGVYLHNTANTTQVDFFQANGRDSVAANLDDATLKVVQISTGQWGYIGPLSSEFGC